MPVLPVDTTGELHSRELRLTASVLQDWTLISGGPELKLLVPAAGIAILNCSTVAFSICTKGGRPLVAVETVGDPPNARTPGSVCGVGCIKACLAVATTHESHSKELRLTIPVLQACIPS